LERDRLITCSHSHRFVGTNIGQHEIKSQITVFAYFLPAASDVINCIAPMLLQIKTNYDVYGWLSAYFDKNYQQLLRLYVRFNAGYEQYSSCNKYGL
jgi:hypothetical protein